MHDKFATLTESQLSILRDKATEPPSHRNQPLLKRGTFICRGCGKPLFRGGHEFLSTCGWPSFDDEMAGAVRCCPDADGRRTEITCSQCHSHLGHVFHNEGFTEKNLRHCVNAAAIEWVDSETVLNTGEAFFAGGCFWGVEYLFSQLAGVIKTEVGYMGGKLPHPTYEAVCRGDSGHIEALRVVYDAERISYTQLLQFFFEIHDPTQVGGQGPDIGDQYASVIFYYEEQESLARAVRQKLVDLGYAVTTVLQPVSVFWPAEAYHQAYYLKTGKQPYCHVYRKKFP